MKYRHHFPAITKFICGFLCSFSFSLFTRQFTIDTVGHSACRLPKPHSRYHSLSEEVNAKDLVLVAVMTHIDTMMTRAVGINETWAHEIPGKLLFFVGESENRTEVDLPLIVLPVVDDVYPPQRKDMLMLKYIYENYAERFRWFIRADDDVYFQGDNLARLLRSINSNDDILLGHPGTGTETEKGKLGLSRDTNFCIGGTGIIMSQPVLQKVYPNLEHCLGKTVTAHEDSEIGRCLRKFVGVQCPWGYETNEFFHREYNTTSAYHGDLDSVTMSFEKVITLHPVEDVRYQYRLHVHYLNLKERLNENRAQKLRKNLKETKKLLSFTEDSLSAHLSSNLHCRKDHCEQFHDKDSTHDVDIHPATWTLFNGTRKFTTNGLTRSPVEIIQGSEDEALDRVVKKAKLCIKEESKFKLYHALSFSEDRVGYVREHPVHGNAYDVQYSVKVKHHVKGVIKTVRFSKRVRLRERFAALVSRVEKTTKPKTELINIVLPLSGSFKNFQNFMKNVEEMLVKFREVLQIVVVYFRQVTSPKPFKSLFKSCVEKFRQTKFVWLELNDVFDANVAMKAALKSLPKKNNLLFFSQVELLFDSSFLQRCRENTEPGKIFAPVSFRTNPKIDKEKLVYTENYSRLMQDDFSIFCAYSDDVVTTNTRHAKKKLGPRETPLVEQFLSRDHKLEIFHAPDPGLLRSFDVPRCTTEKHSGNCKDGFNSKRELFDHMMKKKYLVGYL